MKRIRYTQGMGESVGPGIQAGEIRDVPDGEAERLIEKGIAEPASGKATSKKAGAGETPKRRSGRKATSKKAAAGETPKRRSGRKATSKKAAAGETAD